MDEATDKITRSSDDDDQETEQIRADIEDTRAEMSQTINEIQERLSPEHLMGQVKETVREATIGKVERVMETIGEVTEPAREAMSRAGTTIKEAGTSVGYSVWRNPLPIALIGLGVGMLFMKRRRGNGYAYDRSQSTTPRTRQTGQVKEGASNLSSRAMESANTVSTRFGQVLRDNPLAVGAVAVAAGTAVGLALPSTRFESEYIGETSERLVDRAQEVARGAIDKVQDAAKQMTQPENNPQQG